MYHPDLYGANAQYIGRERLREAEHVRAIKRARTEERAARRAARKEERRRSAEDAPDTDARARFGRAA
jgi:Flp pilus assembly protein TadB